MSIKPFSTFSEILELSANRFANHTAFSIFNETEKEWDAIDYKTLDEKSRELALRMMHAGVMPLKKVALLGEPSISWVITFYAALLAGATVIPLDIKLGELEITELVKHSEPDFIFVSDSFLELGRTLRYLNPLAPIKLFRFKNEWPLFIAHQPVSAREWISIESQNEIAIICYTSGTSGQPKGVMVKRSSLLFEAEAMNQLKDEADGTQRAFSILPFNHIYGIITALVCSIRNGYELCMPHAMTPEAIRFCLKNRKINQIVAVPLYLKVVMNAILGKVSEKGKVKKWIFDRCLNLSLKLKSKAFVDLVFKEIHKNFDGHLKKFICGGAPLTDEIYDFFKAIHIPIYVGYGLTETSPLITVNTDHGDKRGTVGKPLSGIELKIADDGEVLTRGPHVMKGYYKNQELTDEVIDEQAWFHTGDIGQIDQDGYLKLLGRKKSLIVLANGKKVHPEEVETVLCQSQLIRYAGVVGLRDTSSGLGERVVAVVQPSDEMIAKYSNKTEELNRLVKEDVARLMRGLVDYKRPREVHTWKSGLPLTSAMKVKSKELRDLLEKDA